MKNLCHHELLDRLYLMCDMYNDYIVEHDSDDILSKKQKEKIRDLIWEQYQLVGAKIDKEEDKDE